MSRTRASCSGCRNENNRHTASASMSCAFEVAQASRASAGLVERHAARRRDNRPVPRTSPVQAPRHQRRRLVVHDVEDRGAVGPRLLGHFVDAAETFRHQQPGPDALAFEQRIGADRGAVTEISRSRRAGTCPCPISVSMPCRIARDGSSGVDGTLVIETAPSPRQDRRNPKTSLRYRLQPGSEAFELMIRHCLRYAALSPILFPQEMDRPGAPRVTG